MAPNDVLIAILEKSFNDCWSRDTSSDEAGWTPENPSYGHCAVATLIAQSVLGGELIRYDLKGTSYEHLGSHYKLCLPDGTILDLTEAQFQGQPPAWGEPKVRTREELLDPIKNPKNKRTLERYELLKRRVIAWLNSFS